jgi:hypothetical protein
MSVTNFWFDRGIGNCKNQGQAIALLQDTQSRTYLSDYWVGTGFAIPSTLYLENGALLMMGITEKLQDALLHDYNNGNGITAVETGYPPRPGVPARPGAPGSLKIAYVRRRAGKETKSVVIIADLNLYWAGQLTNWGGQKGWIDMGAGFQQAISINTLARQTIWAGSGKSAEW